MSLIEPPADATAPQRHPNAPAPGERMQSHHAACFGCADLPHGLRIESWAEEGASVRSRFVARPEHQGAPGLLHGGMLTAAFDDCLGQAHQLVVWTAVTARLETDFRRPVPIGATVWLRSRVDAVAGRKLYVSGSAHLDALDGPRVGDARGLFLEVGEQHFLRHSRAEDLEALGVAPDVIAAARNS